MLWRGGKGNSIIYSYLLEAIDERLKKLNTHVCMVSRILENSKLTWLYKRRRLMNTMNKLYVLGVKHTARTETFINM